MSISRVKGLNTSRQLNFKTMSVMSGKEALSVLSTTPTFLFCVLSPTFPIVECSLYSSLDSQPVYKYHWLNIKIVHPCTGTELCIGRTAHRGSRGIALPFLDHGTRRRRGVVTPRPLFTPGKDPITIIQEAVWAPGPVWTGEENLAPTGILSPHRPARSHSLHRLRYPAHWLNIVVRYYTRLGGNGERVIKTSTHFRATIRGWTLLPYLSNEYI